MHSPSIPPVALQTIARLKRQARARRLLRTALGLFVAASTAFAAGAGLFGA